jgi:hypothetical protein
MQRENRRQSVDESGGVRVLEGRPRLPSPSGRGLRGGETGCPARPGPENRSYGSAEIPGSPTFRHIGIPAGGPNRGYRKQTNISPALPSTERIQNQFSTAHAAFQSSCAHRQKGLRRQPTHASWAFSGEQTRNASRPTRSPSQWGQIFRAPAAVGGATGSTGPVCPGSDPDATSECLFTRNSSVYVRQINDINKYAVSFNAGVSMRPSNLSTGFLRRRPG